MEVHSTYKYARISAFKARDVAREIQGLPVSTALDILTFTPRKAAFLIGKTLKSAVANAENNHDLAADQMVVKEATVGEGPTFKRFKPRARGSAGPIRKRTAHIRIILSDEIPLPEPKKKSKNKAKAKAAPKPGAKTAFKSGGISEEEKPTAVEESGAVDLVAEDQGEEATEVVSKKEPSGTKEAGKKEGKVEDDETAELETNKDSADSKAEDADK